MLLIWPFTFKNSIEKLEKILASGELVIHHQIMSAECLQYLKLDI